MSLGLGDIKENVDLQGYDVSAIKGKRVQRSERKSD